MIRRHIVAWLIGIVILCFPTLVKADDFQKDYVVDYYLQATDTGIETKAVFNLRLTNLSGEIIIKTFGLEFPKTFTVDHIQASNNGESLTPQISQDDKNIQLKLDLPNATVGRNTINNIKIEFNQQNLFKVSGNVWEVILPTLDTTQRNSYQVNVHLPQASDKKISVSKPKPDSIEGTIITWNNPTTKTIYAVFGEKQLYQATLTYHLINPKFTPVYTDIALVPETTYQKTYIHSLAPTPSLVYLDEDGNYLARYVMKPKEKFDVIYRGIIESSVKPRDELRNYIKTQFTKQKSYLTQTPGFWANNSTKSFASVAEVYTYVTNTFSYNYKRISQNVKRLGAEVALSNPQNAVCTEFTDGFIALARDNGFYTREIQGYGYSNDPNLRPISLESDILHAWPEYYDSEQNLWIPIDPTWQNTSGIDYFNSFDLNHIAFVIHGKRPDYPYPAGTYKEVDSKDIQITTTSTAPVPITKYLVSPFAGQKRIHPGKMYSGTITVKNIGNTFAWNVPVSIQSSNLLVNIPETTLTVMAPYEERKITFSYSSKPNTFGNHSFDFLIDGKKMQSVEIQVIPLILDIVLLALPFAIVIGILITLLIRKVSRKKLPV